MNFLKKLSFLLLIGTAFLSCKNESDSTRKILIISTNDIHAQISRFPQLASFVKQKRAEGNEIILADAGDRFSGNPYVDNAAEKGKPMIELMNKLGYDIATMGNHDFDFGQTVLKKRIREANFNIICANIVSTGSEVGEFAPYQIIDKGGIKFCFLSLIQTGSNHIPATNPGNLENISFRYFKDVAPEYKKLKDQCDVMIGLTHLGFAGDSLLALVMPEFDVIVGGHSHTVIDSGKYVNGVLINQTGSYLNYAGVTELTFKGKKLIDKSYHLVSLKDIGTPDQEVALMVEEYNNQPEFKKVVARATAPLRTKEDVASMVTDAMCDATHCMFAFYNKGGVRLNSIPQGDITLETVYKIEPFSNYIVTHEWTLDQMKEFILQDYNKRKSDQRYINYFISAGKYEIICDKNGEGIDVKFYDAKGKQLKDHQRKMPVAFSNYVTSSQEYAKGGKNTGIYITDAVSAFLQKQKSIQYDGRRVFIK